MWTPALTCAAPAQDPACRRLTAIALTDDHSPGRADERARILAAGGTVSAAPHGARALLLLHRPVASRSPGCMTCWYGACIYRMLGIASRIAEERFRAPQDAAHKASAWPVAAGGYWRWGAGRIACIKVCMHAPQRAAPCWPRPPLSCNPCFRQQAQRRSLLRVGPKLAAPHRHSQLPLPARMRAAVVCTSRARGAARRPRAAGRRAGRVARAGRRAVPRPRPERGARAGGLAGAGAGRRGAAARLRRRAGGAAGGRGLPHRARRRDRRAYSTLTLS